MMSIKVRILISSAFFVLYALITCGRKLIAVNNAPAYPMYSVEIFMLTIKQKPLRRGEASYLKKN
jgi:hypothetical protein